MPKEKVERNQELAAAYNAGKTYRELMEEFHLARTTLKRLLELLKRRGQIQPRLR